MPLEAPRLDDRTFDELLRDAKHRLRERCPEWTDASDSDPGIVLLELFAYLTDTMLYRLNRVPDKVYVELLKLMGVRLAPPAAAATELTFSRLPGHSGRIDVPRGTRVAAARPGSGGPPVVFATDRDAHLAPGAERVVVGAHHAELVPAEEIGRGTGRAGLTLALRRAPVVAPTGLDDDLVVAVELDEAEEGGDGVVAHDGSRFRVCGARSRRSPGTKANASTAPTGRPGSSTSPPRWGRVLPPAPSPPSRERAGGSWPGTAAAGARWAPSAPGRSRSFRTRSPA